MKERIIKFRAWDDGKMIYSHNNSINHTNVQLEWFYKVIRKDSIIMQFTGLEDDADEEIYESDIVLDILDNRLVVEWNDDTRKFQFSDGTDINDGNRYGTYKRIIGNIYETPNLLTTP